MDVKITGSFVYEGDRLGGYMLDGDDRTYCPSLWGHLLREYEVQAVIDVGCGQGFSARWFQDHGCDVLGVDGAVSARDMSVIPQSHVVHDYDDGPYCPDRRFDLAWCSEFLEHLDEEFLPNVMETFQSASVIVATAASPGQGGWHHVNERPMSYWIAKFLDFGFGLDNSATDRARAAVKEPGQYFSQTGMIFLNFREDTNG